MFLNLKRKFKTIPIENRENKQTLKKMFEKANSSSLAGAPLSWVMNIIITVPVTAWGLSHNLDSIVIAALLWIPFYLASLQRQIMIDWVYAAYNINIDPSYLIRKLVKKLRKK